MTITIYEQAQPNPNEVTPIVNAVKSFVDTAQQRSISFGNAAVADTKTLMDQVVALVAGVASVPSIDVILSPVEALVSPYVSPTVPAEPSGLEVVLPEPPAALALTTVSPLNLATPPEFTDQPLPLNLPAVPAAFAISAPAAPTLTAVAIPAINALVLPDDPQLLSVTVPTSPQANFPAAPSALAVSVPTRPTLAQVTTPSAPSISLPEVPNLIGVNIPTAPTLNLPTFTATLGNAPVAPANSYAHTELAYASPLLTSLQALLASWVTGASTGIDPTVEAAIWRRQGDRDATVAARKAQEVRRDFASLGFTKPPGAMSIALLDAAQEAQDASLAVSREIAINQATLEQANRKSAMELVLQVESQLMTLFNQAATRTFESAKFVQQIAVDIYQSMVQGYSAEAQAFATRAQVFKELIAAELSRLEVFRTELEAQKLVGELNLQNVEVYKARIQGVQAVIDIFKAQVEAANLTLTGNKILIDGFGVEVQAYDSTVKAKVSEYTGFETVVRAEISKFEVFRLELEAQKLIGQMNAQTLEGFKARVEAAGLTVQGQRLLIDAALAQQSGNKQLIEMFSAQTASYEAQGRVHAIEGQIYESSMKGEGIKVDLWDKQIGAFGKRTDAYKAGAEAAIGAKNIEVKIGQEVPLEVYKVSGEVYRSKIEGESSRASAVAKILEVRAQLFEALSRGEGVRVNSEVEQVKAQGAIKVAEGGLRVEAARANGQAQIQQFSALTQAMEGLARIAAQLAAGAMASMHTSTSLSAGGSASSGFSASNSTSQSASLSLSDTTSHNTSVSTTISE